MNKDNDCGGCVLAGVVFCGSVILLITIAHRLDTIEARIDTLHSEQQTSEVSDE